MGLGFTEILFIAGAIALLFGPGAVLVWWLMTQLRASRSSAQQDAAGSSDAPAGPIEPDDLPISSATSHAPPADPVLAAAAHSLAQGAITQEQYDEIERTLA